MVATEIVENTELDADGSPVGRFVAGAVLPAGLPAWERLGVGHRCETWLAWSPALWSPVVIKFPRPHQVEHPRARAALGREVAALDGNLHPALPRLYEDGTAADVPFVVLEYVDGVPLDCAIDEAGPFEIDEVSVLAVTLLAALRTIHRRGLVHVDIKPDNIVLRAGRPVLLDCGSARPLGAPQPRGLLIGTPGYAAPDLEAGDPISAAMDVYGVGVTLHEALTGRPAFVPEVPAEDRPAPSGLPDCEVSRVVARMIATDPDARPGLDAALDAFATLAEGFGHQLRPPN